MVQMQEVASGYSSQCQSERRKDQKEQSSEQQIPHDKADGRAQGKPDAIEPEPEALRKYHRSDAASCNTDDYNDHYGSAAQLQQESSHTQQYEADGKKDRTGTDFSVVRRPVNCFEGI